jgi:hypothetical protein
MATFSSLFEFPDLSDDQLELSSPPDSGELECTSEACEDEEDEWYNMPSDFEDEDEDDDSATPPLTLLVLPAVTSTAFAMPKTARKEHSTSARIKAIYILVKFWWIERLNLPKAGWDDAYIHEVRFPRTFYKLRITKLGLQIRRQNTWPVLPPKPKSTILEEKKSANKIKEATGVTRTRAYALVTVARERG